MEFEGIMYVYPSRFRKILSDYFTMQGVYVEGALDNYATHYDFYILSQLDENGNSYKIVKQEEKGLKAEYKGKCVGCNCDRKKRMINPETNICYYREAIESNYTTKI